LGIFKKKFTFTIAWVLSKPKSIFSSRLNLKTLLEKGVDVNHADEMAGHTALLPAAGNLNFCQLMTISIIHQFINYHKPKSITNTIEMSDNMHL